MRNKKNGTTGMAAPICDRFPALLERTGRQKESPHRLMKALFLGVDRNRTDA